MIIKNSEFFLCQYLARIILKMFGESKKPIILWPTLSPSPVHLLPLVTVLISRYVEVAEHIPRKFEMQFIDNIIRHARIGIVLSWAVPGQSGFRHVNGRENSWVIKQLAALCFDYDQNTSENLKKNATLHWLQANTNAFRRRTDCPIDELQT